MKLVTNYTAPLAGTKLQLLSIDISVFALGVDVFKNERSTNNEAWEVLPHPRDRSRLLLEEKAAKRNPFLSEQALEMPDL